MRYPGWMEKPAEVIEALVRLRRMARLTQRELGEKIGVNHSTVASFERTGANPRLDSLLRYLEGVGADLGDLAREAGRPIDPVRKAIEVADYRIEDEPGYRRELLEDLARFGAGGSAELQELKERLEKLEREVRGEAAPGREEPFPNGTEE